MDRLNFDQDTFRSPRKQARKAYLRWPGREVAIIDFGPYASFLSRMTIYTSGIGSDASHARSGHSLNPAE